MSTQPRQNGPEFFHYAEEFCRKSGPLNSRAIDTPAAAVLNGLELVAAALAALAAAAIVIILYITTAPVSILSHSATFNVNVYNRNNDEPVSYILVLANDPENKRIDSGVLEEDQSRLTFRDLESGTTYKILYFTTEDGELKQLDEFLFTTRGEAPSGAPADNSPSANPPGDSNQNPPAKDPTPKPEDPAPEDSSEPAVSLPEASTPIHRPAPGNDDEDDDDDGGNNVPPPSSSAPQPSASEPPTPEPPKATVQGSDLDSVAAETVYAFEDDYEYFNVRYRPSTFHSFLLPDGVFLERIDCYGIEHDLYDETEKRDPINELTDENASDFDYYSAYFTFSTEWPYVNVRVTSTPINPGNSITHQVVLHLSDGSTVETEKTVYTPRFIPQPTLEVEEQVSADGIHSYIFTVTGSAFCPPDSTITISADLDYLFNGYFPDYEETLTVTLSGSGSDQPFILQSTPYIFTEEDNLSPGQILLARANVKLAWDACRPDALQLSKELTTEYGPPVIHNSASNAQEPPVMNFSLPVTHTVAAGPPVRLPDGISNVSANGDGSYSYTETHVFRELPGEVTSVTIERNGVPTAIGYQAIRSGDTLTVILDPQTLSPGASATGKVSIACSGQAKSLRSTVTVTGDMLQASAG